MKLKIVFLLIFLGTTSWAQNNNKIETLIQVWGFLKYNHPQVATGVVDWDMEFVEKWQEIQNTTTVDQQNKIYVDWLAKLKTPKPCLECGAVKTTAYAGNVVLDWINEIPLNDDIKNQLHYILQNRNLGKNYFVQFHQKTQLPLFNNERLITSAALPNKSQRILALARYWNAINYFYPYKHLMAVKWQDVLTEMLPDFASAASATAYQECFLKMNKDLAHSSAFIASDLIFDKIGKKKIPFKLEYVQQKWKVVEFENDSLAHLGSLQLGDEILEVAGKPIQTLVDEYGVWMSNSNPQSLMVSVAATLLNGAEDQVDLTISRSGETSKIVQKRYAVVDFYWDKDKSEADNAWNIVDDKIIWLKAAELEYNQINAFQAASATMRYLVLDLRDYKLPSGLKLGDYLVPRSKTYAQMIEPNSRYIGNFNTVPKKNEIPAVKRFFRGNTYVLINEKTRGQAELLALLLKGSDRIVTIGSHSSGTLGYLTKILLPGDVNAFFPGIGVQNVDGTDIQQKGIQPDLLLDLGASSDDRKEVIEKILRVVQKTETP